MSEPLLLAGYQAVFPRGFALPCFGTAPRPNRWSIAEAEVQGDHQSRIAGFVPFESDHIVQLPAEDIVKVQAGDPWHDVFLLDDKAWVGTPGAILDQLGDRFEQLTAEAPLEALDLALAAGHADTSEVLRAAQAAVTELHGEDRANAWLSQLIIRPQARVEMRRRLRDAGLDDDQNRVREIQVEQGGSGFRLSMPAQLEEALRRAGRGEALNEAAAAISSALSLDLQAVRSAASPRIGRIRVVGAGHTSPATIIAASGLAEGDVVSDDILNQARERIMALGRFGAVGIALSNGVVEITVHERSTVGGVRFIGATVFTETSLSGVVEARTGAIYFPEMVSRDADRLREFYSRQDFKADIASEANWIDGRVVITFEIREELQGRLPPRAGEDILLWPTGKAGRDVVRAMTPLDWSPDADRAFVIDAPRMRRGVRDGLQLSRVEIGSGRGDIPRPGDYAVIVLIVEDVVELRRALAVVSRNLMPDGQACRVLIAPVLPPDRPSELLGRNAPATGFPLRAALLDTSVVRSPFWPARPGSATRTRLAEFILGAATLMAHDQIGALLKPVDSGAMPLFSWASDQKFGRLALVSESNPWPVPGPDIEDRGFSIMMFDVSGRGPHAQGYAWFGKPSGPFEAFATAAFGAALHGIPPPGSNHPRRDVPERLASLLHAPDRAAFVDRDLGVLAASGGALVTAEAPSLEVLLEAEAMGVNVVRYTDTASMRRLGAPGPIPLLPEEVAIPVLRRGHASSGLAVRGLEHRQISRLPFPTYEALAAGRASRLTPLVRRLRTAVDQMEAAEVAVPFGAAIDAASVNDEIAMGFLTGEQRRPSRTPSFSRPRQWAPPPPGLSRFIFGEVVARMVVDRLADDEVAAGRVMTMDGDLAVPVLLTSRPFQVWARVLCQGANNRFRLTNSAIETFPVPTGMEIVRVGGDETPALVFTDRDLSSMAEALDGQLWTGPMIGSPAVRSPVPIEVDLERALLARYDLPQSATDIEILDRLVKSTRPEEWRR